VLLRQAGIDVATVLHERLGGHAGGPFGHRGATFGAPRQGARSGRAWSAGESPCHGGPHRSPLDRRGDTNPRTDVTSPGFALRLVIAPLRHCFQLSIGQAPPVLREIMVEWTGGAGDAELVGDLLMMSGALSPYPS